jgi:hypothetical protein
LRGPRATGGILFGKDKPLILLGIMFAKLNLTRSALVNSGELTGLSGELTGLSGELAVIPNLVWQQKEK